MIAVIDQSAEDEEIKKALEKNPDISHERSNLLKGLLIYAVHVCLYGYNTAVILCNLWLGHIFTGWNRSSSLLSQKLAIMKLRAEMTQQLEGCICCCRDAQHCYQALVSTPLPASPVLVNTHIETLEQEVCCHRNMCTVYVYQLLSCHCPFCTIQQTLRKSLTDSLQRLLDCYHRYNNDQQTQVVLICHCVCLYVYQSLLS